MKKNAVWCKGAISWQEVALK